MSVSEALKICEAQDTILEKLNFHCRNYCPRVKECNSMLWASIVRSLNTDESSEEQVSANKQAEAALGSLQSLEEAANFICEDGPYNRDGEIACKLDLLDGHYYLR